VAHHLDVGWDLIEDIRKRDLSRRYAKPGLKHLRAIAIDEIAVANGHRYLTVVMDQDSAAIVVGGDGEGSDALKPFWRRLRASGPKIEAVAMDMSAAYQTAVSVHLCKAGIVFDHFHVVELFNDKVSEPRRELCREVTEVQHKEVLKGTRRLLVKNAENLDPEKDEKRRLEEAPELNEPLAVADYLKEDLRRFWEKPGRRFATKFPDGWIRRAEASGIKVLQQMAQALAAHRSDLPRYDDVLITSGPMEGTNNKIRLMGLPRHVRRVPCDSVTLQGLEMRSETNSRDARIRTLCTSFGGSLLSQEHIPIRGRGYSAGVEPGASRFTISRAAVTPRTPSRAGRKISRVARTNRRSAGPPRAATAIHDDRRRRLATGSHRIGPDRQSERAAAPNVIVPARRRITLPRSPPRGGRQISNA
jgi:hypothetical protein